MTASDFPMRLLDGEQVIWTGRPRQGLLFTGRDVFLVPFSLLWGGFAIFWEASVMMNTKSGLFRLWGIPFVLIGLYMIAGRFIVDAWLRATTSYAVTNRRVLIERTGPFSKTTSLSLDRLPEVQLSERPDGTGTLRFGPQAAYWNGNGFGYWSPALDPTPQFVGVANACAVFELIQRAIRSAA